jgi:pimeloyl-ACP methyl ester carboxylesterase
MASPNHNYYKSEKGYRALTQWYESMVGQFSFPFESQFVDTRVGRTHLLAAGPEEAQPFVLVQAIAGSAPLWYHQIPFFARYYRLLALDTPGQPGRSDPNPPPFLEGGYTDWLLDVLDALQIEQVNFAGVSSGGWYAMKLAIHAPERVRKLVLISPTGLARARFPVGIWLNNVVGKKKDDQALEDDLSTRSFLPAGSSREFDRQLARAMALATRHYQIDRSLGIVNERTGRVALVPSMRVLRTLFFPESRANLRKLRTPGLVVLGEHEMLHNAQKAARQIRRSMPTLEVTIIPETGHSAMYDRPDLVNQVILDLLQRPASDREPAP